LPWSLRATLFSIQDMTGLGARSLSQPSAFCWQFA